MREDVGIFVFKVQDDVPLTLHTLKHKFVEFARYIRRRKWFTVVTSQEHPDEGIFEDVTAAMLKGYIYRRHLGLFSNPDTHQAVAHHNLHKFVFKGDLDEENIRQFEHDVRNTYNLL